VKKILLVALLLLVAPVLSFAGSGPMDGPVPPDGISCISVEIDGGQFYHVDFAKPLHEWGQVRAEFVKLGLGLQLRGRITGEPRVQSDATRLLEATKTNSGYWVGNVCYVLATYCAPGCAGQWCVGFRVPSIQ
jgi:hypothetical protein